MAGSYPVNKRRYFVRLRYGRNLLARNMFVNRCPGTSNIRPKKCTGPLHENKPLSFSRRPQVVMAIDEQTARHHRGYTAGIRAFHNLYVPYPFIQSPHAEFPPSQGLEAGN
jgi:hypothetical protein